jgi:hypothetical protein
MRVITSYPIVKDGKVIANKIAANTLNWSNFPGDLVGKTMNDAGFSKTSTGQAGKVQKVRGAKAIDILSKAKEAGLGDAALKTISALRNKTEVPIREEVAIVPVEKGMSTNTKIAIGVAVAAVLGVTIYAVAKK